MRPSKPPKSCWCATQRCTDGYDRPGMVHEARGQLHEAANCYRNVVEFALANPEHCDPEFVASFLGLIAKLEASEAEAKRAVTAVDRSG